MKTCSEEKRSRWDAKWPKLKVIVNGSLNNMAASAQGHEEEESKSNETGVAGFTHYMQKAMVALKVKSANSNKAGNASTDSLPSPPSLPCPPQEG